ncbi:MAG: hypothetical protein R3F59_15945 [Myxococcota bacterium]
MRRWTTLWLAGVVACSPVGGSAEKNREVQDRSAKEDRVDEFSLVIAGYGVEATPRLPVGVAHLEDDTLIFGPMNAAQAEQGGVRNALLRPGDAPTAAIEKRPGTPVVTYSSDQPGTTVLALGNGMDSYEAVLTGFRAADQPPQWTLVTDGYEIRWPTRFTLRADGDPNPRSWPYEFGLDGSAENLVFLQGPLTGAQVPTPKALVAPGMERVGEGEVEGANASIPWFELAYEHGGAKWKQRFYYIPFDAGSTYLLRAQGTDGAMAVITEGADLIATSFRSRR